MSVIIYSNKKYGRLLNDNDGFGYDYVLSKDNKVVYGLRELHRQDYPRGVPIKDAPYLYIERVPMKKVHGRNGNTYYVSCKNKYTWDTFSKKMDAGEIVFVDKHYRYMNTPRLFSKPYYAYYSSIEDEER